MDEPYITSTLHYASDLDDVEASCVPLASVSGVLVLKHARARFVLSGDYDDIDALLGRCKAAVAAARTEEGSSPSDPAVEGGAGVSAQPGSPTLSVLA